MGLEKFMRFSFYYALPRPFDGELLELKKYFCQGAHFLVGGATIDEWFTKEEKLKLAERRPLKTTKSSRQLAKVGCPFHGAKSWNAFKGQGQSLPQVFRVQHRNVRIEIVRDNELRLTV